MKYGKIIFVIIMLLSILFITGCWDRKEINDVAILQLTAVDVGADPKSYQAHIQVAIPSKKNDPQSGSGGKNNKSYLPLTIYGNGLDELTITAERELSRSMITSHRRIFIVGEALARRGIKDILDHISRDPKMRLSTYFIVAKGMKAKELVETEYPLEPYPAEALRELIKLKMRAPTKLRDFFVASTSPGMQPIAAGFSKSDGKDAKFSLNSLAIFRNFKLVGFVEDEEAMALNSMFGGETTGIIKLKLPDEKKDISVLITELKVQRSLKIKKEKPIFRFKVHASGRIVDNMTSIDLANPSYIDKLNIVLQKKIEQVFEALATKLQTEYEADSIGLGADIHKKNPKYWKKIENKWPKIFKEQEINWEVKANITGAGISGAPLYLPENEVKK